ncbi:MAG: transglutaminase-like domain-containing protein, partial [Candidatus Humimicrobiaceae bacterium]
NKFLIIRTHEANVQIKYKIENKGPGSINNIQCRIETPYDFFPFQTIIKLSADNENNKEIADKNGNTIYRFNLDNLKEGLISESNLDCVVNISEFIIKPQDLIPQKYDYNDSEIKKFTKSEKFIDSDSNKIINAANTITAGEEDPFKKAELLYNFVIKQLDYDYERMEEKSFKISNASDILNWDKGVCTDYSLLYASLCRAAGIPCKFIVGLSLHSISSEYNGVSSMTHAWNEIKLPGYGWVPVDATSEIPFAGANYNLNLKTFEGTGSLYQSTKIDGYPANALGYFYYYPDAGIIPEIVTENIFSVTGISKNNGGLN